MGTWSPFEVMESCRTRSRSVVVYNTVNVLNAAKLFNFKWVLCYVNFISIKFLVGKANNQVPFTHQNKGLWAGSSRGSSPHPHPPHPH